MMDGNKALDEAGMAMVAADVRIEHMRYLFIIIFQYLFSSSFLHHHAFIITFQHISLYHPFSLLQPGSRPGTKSQDFTCHTLQTAISCDL
jgi:hypothetical protein